MKQIEIQKITKLFVFMSILINAGDPCPIHFKFYDAGMPSWLSQKKVLSTLEDKSLVLNQMQDPLISKLIKQLVDDRERENREFPCTTVKSSVLDKDKKKKVHAEIFFKNKRFDCKNAHKKINALKLVDKYSKGNVFVIRGSKRILFAHLGWKTMCVNYNGNLTQIQRRRVLSDLFDDYIKDRHLNP